MLVSMMPESVYNLCPIKDVDLGTFWISSFSCWSSSGGCSANQIMSCIALCFVFDDDIFADDDIFTERIVFESLTFFTEVLVATGVSSEKPYERK